MSDRSKDESTNADYINWIHQTAGDHPIWRCSVFERTILSEKVELVKATNACLAGFEVGHVAIRCTRELKCKEDDCDLPHHQLLHRKARNSYFLVTSVKTKQKLYCKFKKVTAAMLWSKTSNQHFSWVLVLLFFFPLHFHSNEHFSKRPVIMNKLSKVLLRFREERIGSIGEIRKIPLEIK